MVTKDSVAKQLKNINFNEKAWGRAEVNELHNILLDHEDIYECVNGIYDGGFALLVATNVRLLLVDKKPLNYLTVEDLRFDMINELDYSHRLIGARINISAGNKNLNFFSFNQQRLRKAIGHVQRCMAEAKKQFSDHQEDQKQHLAQINSQLQAYLLAQHQEQENLRQQLEAVQQGKQAPEDIKLDETFRPSPELSDYLLAQSLLSQVDPNASASKPSSGSSDAPKIEQAEEMPALPAKSSADTSVPTLPSAPEPSGETSDMADLYAAGMQEIYGRNQEHNEAEHQAEEKRSAQPRSFDINPLHIAYSKLPLALRNKKFGRPSFHAHSRAAEEAPFNPTSNPNPQYFF